MQMTNDHGSSPIKRANTHDIVNGLVEKAVLRKDEKNYQCHVNVVRIAFRGGVEDFQYGDYKLIQISCTTQHKSFERFISMEQRIEQESCGLFTQMLADRVVQFPILNFEA